MWTLVLIWLNRVVNGGLAPTEIGGTWVLVGKEIKVSPQDKEAAEWAAAEPWGGAPGLQTRLKELKATARADCTAALPGRHTVRSGRFKQGPRPALLVVCVGGGSSLAGSFPSSESPSPGCQSLKRGNMKRASASQLHVSAGLLWI